MFSRPFGAGLFCYEDPGFRAAHSILGYYQPSLTGLLAMLPEKVPYGCVDRLGARIVIIHICMTIRLMMVGAEGWPVVAGHPLVCSCKGLLGGCRYRLLVDAGYYFGDRTVIYGDLRGWALHDEPVAHLRFSGNTEPLGYRGCA